MTISITIVIAWRSLGKEVNIVAFRLSMPARQGVATFFIGGRCGLYDLYVTSPLDQLQVQKYSPLAATLCADAKVLPHVLQVQGCAPAGRCRPRPDDQPQRDYEGQSLGAADMRSIIHTCFASVPKKH